MAMSDSGKVALGVGITLALAGVGVGLYFVFRKPKTEEQQSASILAAQRPPVTLAELQKQNPNMSNAELLKALGTLLKSGKTQIGGGSGGGGGIGGGGGLFSSKPKPTGSAYDYSPKTAYNYQEGATYSDTYGASSYAAGYTSEIAPYDYSSSGGASYSGYSGSYSGGGAYSGGGY